MFKCAIYNEIFSYMYMFTIKYNDTFKPPVFNSELFEIRKNIDNAKNGWEVNMSKTNKTEKNKQQQLFPSLFHLLPLRKKHPV